MSVYRHFYGAVKTLLRLTHAFLLSLAAFARARAHSNLNGLL